MKLVNKLPKILNTPWGLRDKLTEIYRETLDSETKAHVYYDIQNGVGIFYDRETIETIATYTAIPQLGNNKYKLNMKGGDNK